MIALVPQVTLKARGTFDVNPWYAVINKHKGMAHTTSCKILENTILRDELGQC